ncbi:MAG: AI-2E family transporter, partial [Clostridia bacterium]|nr:AI-2E family transporter [Clostridia bacterium]
LKFIALYTVLAILALLFIIIKRESFSAFIAQIFRILRPVIIGAIIAYLCNPIFRMFEIFVFPGVRSFSARRTLSLIGTYIVLVLIFAILLMLIIPQLFASALDFLENYETLLETTLINVNGLLAQLNDQFHLQIPNVQANSLKQGLDWLLENVDVDAIMNRILSGNTILVIFEYLGDTFFVLTDIIFGLFISIYLLSGKERIYASIMRTRKALFNNRINERITRICTIADESFGGFLRGKTLDSTIVGVLVYIIISIMDVPYALLIAVIIGITDIVPVVGPWVGVIPSALIILLTDPIKVIPFLLCILIVQQIDGNIIAPKILGENTGVSSLCVMISITVMGAIWGLAGMVLGVPLFATIIELTKEFLNKRLEDKGLPIENDDDVVEEKKKPKLRREVANLADGFGPLTKQEKKHLLAFALANKYDLYTPQNNATLATCVGEYLDAMPKEEINEHVFEATVEEAIDNIEVPAEGMEAPTPQPKE